MNDRLHPRAPWTRTRRSDYNSTIAMPKKVGGSSGYVFCSHPYTGESRRACCNFHFHILGKLPLANFHRLQRRDKPDVALNGAAFLFIRAALHNVNKASSSDHRFPLQKTGAYNVLPCRVRFKRRGINSSITRRSEFSPSNSPWLFSWVAKFTLLIENEAVFICITDLSITGT